MSERPVALMLLAWLALALPLLAPRPDAALPSARGDSEVTPLLTQPVVVALPQKGNVYSVAVSPDSRTVAGGDETTVRLWDLRTGKERQALDGHRNTVEAVTFSPDGRLLASGSSDRTIRLWDAATGRELRQLLGHGKGVTALTFTTDGKGLVSGGKDETVRLWDVASGRETRQFLGHDDIVITVAASPDGKLLASTGHDKTVRLWATATGDQLRVLVELKEVFALAFSPDGKMLATGSRGATQLLDVATGKVIFSASYDNDPVHALAFSADGKLLATTKEVIELVTRQSRYEFARALGRGRAVVFSPDGQALVTGGNSVALVHWLGGTPEGSQPAPSLSAAELTLLWQELANGNAARAHGAMATFTRTGPQTVPWFGERLIPAAAKGRSPIAQLITDLDSERFVVRQRAVEELGKLGDLAETSLRKALTEKPTLEVRRSVEDLLRKVDTSPPSPDRLRMVRSVEVLERIGNEESRKLLEALTRGEPGALLTVEAKGALDRLNRRTAVKP